MSSTVTSSRPQLEPHLNQPELGRLRSAVLAGDWPAVAAFFAELGHQEDVSFAASVVARTHGAQRLLERAMTRHPREPLPRALLAGRYIRIGWDVRSSTVAQYVSQEQFSQFFQWLRKAERLLIDVCAEHPGYALGWELRVTTARGLQLGPSEARRRQERLAAHHPHHYPAQSQLLQFLCPKWSGSWEEAFAFARDSAAAAPDGSLGPVLIAEAHLEKWLDLQGGNAAAHLARPAVRDELRDAAARSVLHPDHRPGFHWIDAHGYFAAAFSLGGHHTEAARHFQVLGDRLSRHPWSYLGDPVTAFLQHRSRVRAQG